MKLKFEYTVDSEINRVKSTLEKKGFFKKIEYRLGFPRGFNLDSTNFTNLENQIKNEFALDKIDVIKKDIADKWAINNKLINDFIDSTPYDKPETLDIFLTQYGVGGSYNPPNRIIINVYFATENKFQTVVHELVHLLIEKPVIQKFKIEHEPKEALVDYILINNKYIKKILPDYKAQQRFIDKLPNKELLDKLTWV